MIKIIRGSYGQRTGHVVKAVGPGTVLELEKEKEARLVKLGVAEYIESKQPEEAPKPPQNPEGDNDEGEGLKELPEYNVNMKLDDLKKIAEAYGVDASGLKSKQEVVDAIDEAKALSEGFGGDGDVVD